MSVPVPHDVAVGVTEFSVCCSENGGHHCCEERCFTTLTPTQEVRFTLWRMRLDYSASTGEKRLETVWSVRSTHLGGVELPILHRHLRGAVAKRRRKRKPPFGHFSYKSSCLE